jgi:hypothetical protein
MPRGTAQTRREFLERTAYGAGLAGMSALVPASTILAEAAEAAARTSGMPAPRNVPIDFDWEHPDTLPDTIQRAVLLRQ